MAQRLSTIHSRRPNSQPVWPVLARFRPRVLAAGPWTRSQKRAEFGPRGSATDEDRPPHRNRESTPLIVIGAFSVWYLNRRTHAALHQRVKLIHGFDRCILSTQVGYGKGREHRAGAAQRTNGRSAARLVEASCDPCFSRNCSYPGNLVFRYRVYVCSPRRSTNRFRACSSSPDPD